LGHPELLVFGLDPETTHRLLNDLGDRVRADESLLPGPPLTFETWDRRVGLEKVPQPREIVFTANRFYQHPAEYSVPVLQVSYDDEDGRFPWEGGRRNADRQPRPGTFCA
jgi:hypothetical protein